MEQDAGKSNRESVSELLRRQARLRAQTDLELQQDLAQEAWLKIVEKGMTDELGELKKEIEIAKAVAVINSAMLDHLRKLGITSQKGRKPKERDLLIGDLEDLDRREIEISRTQFKSELIYRMGKVLDEDEFAVLMIRLGWSDLITCRLQDVAIFLAVRHNANQVWPVSTIVRNERRAVAKMKNAL